MRLPPNLLASCRFIQGRVSGGHCIPIDPFYLSWKSKEAGIEARFIELAGHINGRMPEFVVEKIRDSLNDSSKSVRGSNVHVLGVAYKRDIDDMRESPALDIMLLLERLGASVSYSDPFISSLTLNGKRLKSQDLITSVASADCVAIVTDHTGVDYATVVQLSKVIVDTRNALKGLRSKNIIRL